MDPRNKINCESFLFGSDGAIGVHGTKGTPRNKSHTVPRTRPFIFINAC